MKMKVGETEYILSDIELEDAVFTWLQTEGFINTSALDIIEKFSFVRVDYDSDNSIGFKFKSTPKTK